MTLTPTRSVPAWKTTATATYVGKEICSAGRSSSAANADGPDGGPRAAAAASSPARHHPCVAEMLARAVLVARYAPMDATTEGLEVPTAEVLLSIRTPAELAISPHGSRLAFALHATVADEGLSVPSDVFVSAPSHTQSRCVLPTARRRSGHPTGPGSRSCRTVSRPGTSFPTRCRPREASRLSLGP